MTSPVLPSPARRRGPRGAASFVLLTVAAVVSLAAGQTLVPRGLRAEAARLLQELAALRGLSSPDAPPRLLMLTKHGLTPAPPDVPLVAWSRGSSTFAIERHGRTVLLLEGVPTSALDALRTAVWARPVLY